MNPQDLKLYALLGSKELSFGTLVMDMWGDYRKISSLKEVHQKDTIINHEPTIHDFHKWLNEKLDLEVGWTMNEKAFIIPKIGGWEDGKSLKFIQYDSSLTLLQQAIETKQQIIDLITSNL